MAPRLPALLPRPLAFVRRSEGMGSPPPCGVGLCDGLRLTADGEAVLHSSARVSRFGLRRISAVRSDRIGASVLPLSELLGRSGVDFDLLLDAGDGAGVEAAVDCALAAADGRGHGSECLSRLWLSCGDFAKLCGWRKRWPQVKLVYSLRRRRVAGGLEQLAGKLAEVPLDALGMPCEDWTGGTAVLLHRFGVLALGWGAEYERTIAHMLDSGLDGLSGDSAKLLREGIDRLYPTA